MKKQAKKTNVFGQAGLPIPQKACRARLDIEEAVVADGVTEIGEEAFSGCLRLETVRLPASVVAIRHGAFKGCAALKSIVLPEGLRKIEGLAFLNCAALENVVVPGSVAEIPMGAFCRCTALKSVVLREGVERIGSFAFGMCTALESVAIPESVEDIGEHAFVGCTRLEKIGYSGKSYRFEGGAMLSGDGTKLLRWMGWLPAFSKVAEVPDSVTEVGKYAFYSPGFSRSELETVRLPAGVVKIGRDSFWGCTRLKNIEYSGKAFRFEGGAMLSGDGTTLLRWMGWIPAFSETAEVPESVTGVGAWAFGKLSKLKRIRLPAGVEEIDNTAFDGCDTLEKVEYSGKAYRFEGGAMLSGDGTKLLAWFGPLPPDKTVIVPDSVTEVGDWVFSVSKVRSVVLPDGLETIGNKAFWGSDLSSILIPETVRSIGEEAFDECETPSLVRHVMVRVLGRGGTCARKTVRTAGKGKSLVRRLQREAARLQADPDAADESAFGLLEYELRVTTCDGREIYSREEWRPVRSPVRNLKENEYSVECSATGEGVWLSRLIRLGEDELEALEKKHGTDDPIEAISAEVRETLEVETAASPALPTLWTGVSLLGRRFKIEPPESAAAFAESVAWGPDGRNVFELP